MVSSKNTKKAKKPIETSLGKAPIKTSEKETDVSHLRKPIETSVTGIKQILNVFESATSEVKDILTYECDIMYECKICRTIFRSLANFILHKRSYCKEQFSPSSFVGNAEPLMKIHDASKSPTDTKTTPSRLGKIIEKLHDMDKIREMTRETVNQDLSSEPCNKPVKSMDDHEEKAANFNKILLEKIESNDSGIFQTLIETSPHNTNLNLDSKEESMKTQVMELHKKIDSEVPVVDSVGNVSGFTNSDIHTSSIFPKSKLVCTECNQRFATRKSLAHHAKYVHNPTRIVFLCPTCKDTFANPWCVYRHLLKIHRMTNKQVRRMREQVHNSWVKREDVLIQQKKKSSEVGQSAGDRENQWINDIEGDNDLQMCAGCGKHFERKAALHSHSQMCAKRLEMCNTIKENAKKKEEEDANEKNKSSKTISQKSLIKGASKRKCQNVVSYRKKNDNLPASSKQETSKEIKKEKMENRSNVQTTLLPGVTGDLCPDENSTVSSNNFNENQPAVIDASSGDLVVCSSTSPDSALPISLFKNKENKMKKSNKDMSRSSSFIDSTEPTSPISACEIISRTASTEEPIYIGSSDESLPSSDEKPSSTLHIKRETFEECFSAASVGSVCEISDSNEDVKSVKGGQDLFSNEVTFEVFCKTVGEVKNKRRESNYKSSDPKSKKIRRNDSDQPSTTKNDDDDVIFISDSLNPSCRSDEIENGFPGFSNEETTNSACALDLSNLSYNNPLKFKSKESSTTDESHAQSVSNKKGVSPESQKDLKIPLSPVEKKDSNFITRAAPYMDTDKLSCIPCGVNFKSLKLLLWHMSAHFSWFRFQCSKCSFVTFNKLDCISHARKDHNLKENDASNYILPLPNWKTVLMSHEFRLLKDCDDLRGKHTDEKIGIDESSCHLIEDDEGSDYVVSDDEILFTGCMTVEDHKTTAMKNDNAKQQNKLGKPIIDLQESVLDSYSLPEPTELTMPADLSEVIRTFTYNEEAANSDEMAATAHYYTDESNDDWGLSKLCEFKEASGSKESLVKLDIQSVETKKDVVSCSVRPSRVRTKVKQNDDFVYYDSDINNILKVTDKLKSSDSVPSTKNKASTKSVPTTQKRKS